MVLRDIAAGQHSLWLVGEALDAIFDTFADGPLVNVAAASIGLMENLQNLASVLKTRVCVEQITQKVMQAFFFCLSISRLGMCRPKGYHFQAFIV